MPRRQSPPPLRVARPDEKPQQPAARNLAEASERTEREMLVMMRSKLAKEIDAGVPAAYLAPLTRQLLQVDKEIRLLDEKSKQEADEDGVIPDEIWDAEAL